MRAYEIEKKIYVIRNILTHTNFSKKNRIECLVVIATKLRDTAYLLNHSVYSNLIF